MEPNIKTENSGFSSHRISPSGDTKSEYSLLQYQDKISDYFFIRQIKKIPGVSSNKLSRILRLGNNRSIDVFHKNPFAAAFATFAVVVAGLFLFDQGSDYFSASITDVESPLAFDGTVYPYEYAPDWFAVGGKNSRSFSNYSKSELVKAPRYELSKMQNESWVRKYVNPKITYSIVYMGKYKFDHKENTGSHPAVDIKLAPGTPVYSIANGIVVKSKDQSTGYGKHVVVRHDGVPAHGTVYSSYSHFSKRVVNVGDVVKRGQQIGNVGSTGNSTTAHIHFQLDKKGADFYPYWPFSMKDARAAGYNFTSAVNAGFGKANALKYTIHPFEFIHKHEKGTTLIASSSSHSSAQEKIPTVKPTDIPERKSGQNLGSFRLEASPSKILAGEKIKISILVADTKGTFFETFSDNVTISYELNSGKQTQEIFIDKGEGEVFIELDSVGKNKILFSKGSVRESVTVQVVKPKIENNSKVAERELIEKAERETLSDAENKKLEEKKLEEEKKKEEDQNKKQEESKNIKFSHFQFFADNTVEKGKSLEIIAKPINTDGEVIKSSEFPQRGSFIITAKKGTTDSIQLRKGDFENGFVRFNFIANKSGLGFVQINDTTHEIKVTTPEVIIVQSQIFSDISSHHENAKAIAYLKSKGIISGYNDGSFQPTKQVNRGEALKMIFEAMNVSIRQNLDNPFNDVSKRDWFSDYVLSAYNKNIVKGYSDGSFKPGKTVGRAEYFKILINTSSIPLAGMPSKNPFSDVPKTSWFAEYAEFAKNKRLLDFGISFLPNQGVTRGEVAESIYRLVK